MTHQNLDIKRLNIEILESFVKDYGWVKSKEYSDHTTVWKHDNYHRTIWLPPHTDFDDFETVVNNIVTSTAESTSKNTLEINDALIQYYNDKDLIKLRVISDDVSKGKIQISDGTSLYESLQTLLNSALKQVSGIKKEVKELFSNETLLGQTEIGSYVVKTYTPIIEIKKDSKQEEIDHVERRGLGRQVIHKLIKRLELINKVYQNVNKESSTDTILKKLIEHGFTKKECEAIENLFGSRGHRDWELMIQWAKKLDKSQTDSLIRFDHSYSSAAHKVVTYLEALKTEQSFITIEGRVKGLVRDYDEELGTVKLKAKIKGKESTVTLHLNEEDFDIAHSANAERATLKVRGELTETIFGRRKIFEIHNIEELELLPPSENLELNIE